MQKKFTVSFPGSVYEAVVRDEASWHLSKVTKTKTLKVSWPRNLLQMKLLKLGQCYFLGICMCLVHSCEHCSTGSWGSHWGTGQGRAQNPTRVKGMYSESVLTSLSISVWILRIYFRNCFKIRLFIGGKSKNICPHAGKNQQWKPVWGPGNTFQCRHKFTWNLKAVAPIISSH